MSDRPISLLLVDDDPIFRLGLAAALAGLDELQVIAQADSPMAARERLAEQLPEIAIVEPLFRLMPSPGWELCQEIQQTYPSVKICLLSAATDRSRLSSAREAGIEGYFPKGTAIETLVSGLLQIAAGQAQWHSLDSVGPTPEPSLRKPADRQSWLIRWRQSGLEQIDASLLRVKGQLDLPQLSWLDWLFWSGRKRELLAARWLVDRLLPVAVVVVSEPPPPSSLARAAASSPPVPHSQTLFESTETKIQSGLENLTDVPLEIDILKPEKKRELLNIILKQLGKIIDELNFLEVTPEQLSGNILPILKDLWRSSTLIFLRKYCWEEIGRDLENISKALEAYVPAIEAEILARIPLPYDALGPCLFEENISDPSKSPEARARALALFENLIIQVANGGMAFILNYFSEKENIKRILYNGKMISSREIARFRNELSWRYRREIYWQDPKDIFESQYRLSILEGRGIDRISIYAPRQVELQQLAGIPWLATVLLEVRDAIAPRLRTLAGWIGSSLVYLLTQVIGRGIGLIGRGIIQGIGNTLQEARYGKNSKGEKGKI